MIAKRRRRKQERSRASRLKLSSAVFRVKMQIAVQDSGTDVDLAWVPLAPDADFVSFYVKFINDRDRCPLKSECFLQIDVLEEYSHICIGVGKLVHGNSYTYLPQHMFDGDIKEVVYFYKKLKAMGSDVSDWDVHALEMQKYNFQLIVNRGFAVHSLLSAVEKMILARQMLCQSRTNGKRVFESLEQQFKF